MKRKVYAENWGKNFQAIKVLSANREIHVREF